ncbi:hypothetical protein GILI108418_04590 [Gillisia limnaea]
MKLSEIKDILRQADLLQFVLPDGNLVPRHFHVTEIGKVTKHYIDCGGTERLEEVINSTLECQ